MKTYEKVAQAMYEAHCKRYPDPPVRAWNDAPQERRDENAKQFGVELKVVKHE